MSWHLMRKFTRNFDWEDGIYLIRDHFYIRVENDKKNRNILIKMSPDEIIEYGKYLIEAGEWAKKVIKKREEWLRERSERMINRWIDKQGDEDLQHLRPEKILSFGFDWQELRIRYEGIDGNTYEFWQCSDGSAGIGFYEEVEKE